MFDNSSLDLDYHDLDDEEELDDSDDPEEQYHRRVEVAYENLARVVADIESGRFEALRGWKLDRPSPGVLVWTTPSGRRFASTLTGDPLPLPD